MGFIHVENVEMNLDNFLSNFKENITSKIFLISPSNQPYIFLSREERRALFTIKDKQIYDGAVNNIKNTLSNFFTFDFVDVLVEVFRRARANDFKERNKDNPFAHTEKLEADINNLFIDGKKITSLIIEQQRHTQDEIQGVFFTLPSGQEVYPEDLSHGELKRLAIFVLIKYHEMQDSIVLIDEIENGFHLDWQYTIVRNLVEWGKNNQYILATHSYELCTAVTPAHVKEIEPKLTTK
jgi:predicted ATP-binding protein involved in virulence